MDRPSNFDDIHAMHVKYGFAHGGTPRLLDPERFRWRHAFLEEELDEMRRSYEVGLLEDVADALVDLVVVALGTAVEMGLPWQLLWDEVHRANMSKERGVGPRGESAGGDLVKPTGWRAPNHEPLLMAFARLRDQLPEAWRPANPVPLRFYSTCLLNLSYLKREGMSARQLEVLERMALAYVQQHSGIVSTDEPPGGYHNEVPE